MGMFHMNTDGIATYNYKFQKKIGASHATANKWNSYS